MGESWSLFSTTTKKCNSIYSESCSPSGHCGHCTDFNSKFKKSSNKATISNFSFHYVIMYHSSKGFVIWLGTLLTQLWCDDGSLLTHTWSTAEQISNIKVIFKWNRKSWTVFSACLCWPKAKRFVIRARQCPELKNTHCKCILWPTHTVLSIFNSNREG